MDTLKAFYLPVAFASLLVASWVCLDPLLSYIFGFNYFPYFLSAIIGGFLIVATGLGLNLSRLYTHKHATLLVFIIAIAQFSGVGIGSIDLLDIGTLLLVSCWLMLSMVEAKRAVQISPIMYALMALIFLSILALINRPPMGGLIAISEKFVLFFVLVAIINDRKLVRLSAHTLIWTSLFSALVAIGQTVVFWVWGILWTTGIGESQAAGYLKPTPFGVMPRSTGFFPNPAGLNDYLLFTTCMVLFAITATKSIKMKWWYGLILLLNCAAITLTWSASSLSSLGVILILFFYFNRPALSIHYTATIILIGLISYWTGLMEFLYLLMKNYASSSGEVRLRLLELAVESLSRNPFIGMGVQNFANASGNLFQEGVFTVAYPVHNAFGQMATELGLFGALIYLCIVIFIVARIIRILRIARLEENWIFKSHLLGMIPLIIHMFSEPMAYEGTLWLFFGIIEGSAMVLLRNEQAKTSSL